jgi:hypothetical protein
VRNICCACVDACYQVDLVNSRVWCGTCGLSSAAIRSYELQPTPVCSIHVALRELPVKRRVLGGCVPHGMHAGIYLTDLHDRLGLGLRAAEVESS